MESKMEKIISLCKRRGFVYPGSEIYGGLAGTWDYGHYGSELGHNIKELWWKHFVRERDDMFGITSATLMPEAVWKASGHLENFTDPLIECKKCHFGERMDILLARLYSGQAIILPTDLDKLWELFSREKIKCPNCNAQAWAKPKQFNLMFPVGMGTGPGQGIAYLRGEVAQGMFVNFKNILNSMHPKLPFGLAQIGRAYRNEIAPRDFLFRVREFDLMEFEYFVKEEDWEKYFEMWRKEICKWIERVGIEKDSVHELEMAPEKRAHYSKRTIDFEYDYPFGTKELYGLAYRTDYDLKAHNLYYFDEETKESFIPHVVEPTFGHGRTMLAVLLSAYREDGDRVYLVLKPEIAPVKIAVFPLLRNKPQLVEKAKEVYKNLKKEFGAVEFDDRGNIGKRYYSQDEIGTPWCITVDFETLENNTVTIRDRDTAKQERVKVEELKNTLKEKLS